MGRIKNRTWGIGSIIEEFLSKPYMLDMGAGKLGKRYRVAKDVIYEARKRAKETIKGNSLQSKMPKILIFDIETTPLEAYIWQSQVWNAHVSQDKILSEWFMLTWSAKWLGSSEVLSDRLLGVEALEENDKRIVKSLWELFNEADIVIAHNGGKFDVPNMNTRFLVNGFPPPRSYQIIDTLKIARKEFGFTHNNLDALARVFGLEGKIETNFKLWKDCKYGDDNALIKMETYNKQDVLLLEEVYFVLRPWMRSHPNVGLFLESDTPVCSHCGNTHLEWDGGYYFTMVSKFKTLKCQSPKCGAINRQRVTEIGKDVRKNLIVSIAR